MQRGGNRGLAPPKTGPIVGSNPTGTVASRRRNQLDFVQRLRALESTSSRRGGTSASPARRADDKRQPFTQPLRNELAARPRGLADELGSKASAEAWAPTNLPLQRNPDAEPKVTSHLQPDRTSDGNALSGR